MQSVFSSQKPQKEQDQDRSSSSQVVSLEDPNPCERHLHRSQEVPTAGRSDVMMCMAGLSAYQHHYNRGPLRPCPPSRCRASSEASPHREASRARHVSRPKEDAIENTPSAPAAQTGTSLAITPRHPGEQHCHLVVTRAKSESPSLT